MKLSELSYREYLAIEFMPRLVPIFSDSEAASRAFEIADAFLKQAGKEQNEISVAELRASDAEAKFDILQSIHVNMGEDFSSRIALTQIWEFLGVDNQTAAMQALYIRRADRT